jgi:protein-disulfide isomerase
MRKTLLVHSGAEHFIDSNLFERMKRFAPFIIVAAVAILTVSSAVFLYHTRRPAVAVKAVAHSVETTSALHELGSHSAKVTLEEYGDFQCPPCGTLSEPLSGFIREFQPNLRLIYRNFPLPVHLHAREAAVAAEAAGLQGKFWEMHDLLYREQRIWSKEANVQFIFNTYANMLGLDARRFALDMASEKVNDLVETDERRGKSFNVTNTPTLFLNGTVIEPKDLNPASLKRLIEGALQQNAKR